MKSGPIRIPSFRAVGACHMRMQSKIATASRGREIFLVLGNTGFFNRRSPAVNQWPVAGWIAASRQIHSLSLRLFHHHLSVRWTALFWEESLLQRQLSVLGIESSGSHLRRSRGTSTLKSQLFLSCLERNSRSAAVDGWMGSRANGRGF